MAQCNSEAPRLRCIVYTSIASHAWPEPALDALLHQARASNSQRGITGTLLLADQHFTQVLEGPAEAVEHLFATILSDPRHTRLELILRRDVPSRAFPDWAMSRAGALHPGLVAAVNAVVAAIPAQDLAGFEDLEQTAELQPAPSLVRSTQLRLPPQQQRGSDTLERIFAATRRLLRQRGSAEVNVPEIAEQAGVTRATFYRYFPDVTGVVRTGLRRRIAHRHAAWQTVLRTHHFTSDTHLAEMLAALGTQSLLNIRGVPAGLLTAVLPYIEAEMGPTTRLFAADVLEAIERCNLPASRRMDINTMTLLQQGLFSVAMLAAKQDISRLRSEGTRQLAVGMFLGGMRSA